MNDKIAIIGALMGFRVMTCLTHGFIGSFRALSFVLYNNLHTYDVFGISSMVRT